MLGVIDVVVQAGTTESMAHQNAFRAAFCS